MLHWTCSRPYAHSCLHGPNWMVASVFNILFNETGCRVPRRPQRRVFAQSLCNVKVGQIVVHLVMLLWWWGTRCACPCTGYSITSRVPRLSASQAAVAASSLERLVEGRGMGLGTFLLTGVGEKMFCSMRFEKYAHSCLNKNLSSWYFQKLSRSLANCLIEFPQERRPHCFRQRGRQRHAYAGV